jgi:hypothetical protein
MATELRADLNKAIKLVEQFVKRYLLEGALMVMVSIATISSIISWNRAETAIDAANAASATAETWQTMYSETERECRLAQMEVDDFRIILIRAGLNPEHVGEKP